MAKKLAFPGQIGDTHHGKVRNSYLLRDKIVAVTSDRVSAYDQVFPIGIPFKGQILNEIAMHHMNASKDIIPNWFEASPHPNVIIGKKCKPIMIEFVVRAYICGSMWAAYKDGTRDFCGNILPDGLKENDRLAEVILTPTSKAPKGEHDEPLDKNQIVSKNLLPTFAAYNKIKDICLALFERGSKMAAARGLILVDTKYEFGHDEGENLFLIDEIHTPDSSRYFYADSYEEKQKNGLPQKHLSKEFLRDWLKEKGFTGKEGQVMPEITTEVASMLSGRYIELYGKMLGKEFVPAEPIKSDEELVGLVMQELRLLRKPEVFIAMGSDSDFEIVVEAANTLDNHCIGYQVMITSAHRSPSLTNAVIEHIANTTSFQVAIVCAGMSAHLAGVFASRLMLPVIGVPLRPKDATRVIENDSLFSTINMPPGAPVLTVGVNAASNAAIAAMQILSISNSSLKGFMLEERMKTQESVYRKNFSKLDGFPTAPIIGVDESID